MKTRYPNVTVAPDRHGKLRARYRKRGRKAVYMKTLPDQPGFEAEYNAIKAETPTRESRSIPRSVGDLVERYYRSADFATKGNEATRKTRRGRIESFREMFGNDMVADFSFEHIEAILMAKSRQRIDDKGRKVGGEVAARNLRKELVRIFAYAKKLKWITTNPVEEAEKIGKARISGFYPWSEDDIAKYQAKHPIGTKARLALEIILWTAQRRGDARLFGPKHVSNGKIYFTASKNDADLGMPMARDLKRAIDAMPVIGSATYLVTDYGKPFTKEGFGNKMRDWCNAAGLPKCSAHGLRHAIARRMAQMKLTDEQMMAVGGWSSSELVRVYTASVDKEELADGAIAAVESRYSTGKDSQRD